MFDEEPLLCSGSEAEHRIHCNVYITKRVDWYIVSDLEDEPIEYCRTMRAALNYIYKLGLRTVRLRAGVYEGELKFEYLPYEESEIIDTVTVE